MKTKAIKIIWAAIGLFAVPIYLFGWLLHIVARFLLSVSYLLIFDGRRAKDVFTSLFKYYDYVRKLR